MGIGSGTRSARDPGVGLRGPRARGVRKKVELRRESGPVHPHVCYICFHERTGSLWKWTSGVSVSDLLVGRKWLPTTSEWGSAPVLGTRAGEGKCRPCDHKASTHLSTRLTGVLTLLQFLVALLVRLVMGVESERLCAQCAGDRPSIAHPLAMVVGNVVGRAGIGATELAGVHVYEKERLS